MATRPNSVSKTRNFEPATIFQSSDSKRVICSFDCTPCSPEGLKKKEWFWHQRSYSSGAESIWCGSPAPDHRIGKTPSSAPQNASPASSVPALALGPDWCSDNEAGGRERGRPAGFLGVPLHRRVLRVPSTLGCPPPGRVAWGEDGGLLFLLRAGLRAPRDEKRYEGLVLESLGAVERGPAVDVGGVDVDAELHRELHGLQD